MLQYRNRLSREKLVFDLEHFNKIRQKYQACIWENNLLRSVIYFFCCKKLYCFHLVQGLGENFRVVKNPTSDCREGLQIEALTPEGSPPPPTPRQMLVGFGNC